QVLGVEGIGVRDNYFDLGGDSITAVQIIARAHRHGLPITMNQLADELTIENLAAAAADGVTPGADRLVGPVDLTPIQKWFFEEVEEPEHFHHVVRVRSSDSADPARMASAFATLSDHHDALRQSFRETSDGWVSSVVDTATAVPIQIVESSDSPNRDELMAPFELGTAPLMRASLQYLDDGSSEVTLVAHHLIVDGVSWSHFIDDLGYLISSDAGNTAVLPSVTSSIGDWTDLLRASVAAIEVEPWLAVASTEAGAWMGSATTTGVEGVEGVEQVDPLTTAKLLTRAADLGMGLDEMLIAAIATEVHKTVSTSHVRLFLEGHGRESDRSDVDVTRTMGWFTSLYPVAIHPPDEPDAVNAIHAMRDQIRQASEAGADYGIVRYLHPDPGVRASTTLTYRDHLVINYLGRLAANTPIDDPALSLAGPIELDRPQGRNRIFGGEITAYINDEALSVEWITGESSAELLRTVVRAAIESMASLATDQAGSTNAFPLADLDEGAMGKLAAVLGSADGEVQT
ncbi:MAG: condensation domain-containing protein, partial [Acidimicrobiia bacterium]